MLRLIMFFVGAYLCSLSLTFIVIYLNLLNQGYNFLEYVNFIIRRSEVLAGFLGIFLLYLSIIKRKVRLK